ncbi:MAG TPA: terminase [Arsenophonus nasoniae]|uniref:terminase n=1 Tax=Arsenophonus nasoniae TaxID=638 RepID=UPI00387A1093
MAGKTLYKHEYAEQARKLCLLGATDPELADFFEVAVSTIKKWRKDFPEFSAAIKKGKDIADAEVAHSLFNRAKGINVTENKTRIDGDKEIKEITEKFIPPDPTAIIFWLKNRQRDKWGDKKENHNDDENKKIYIHNSLHIPNSIENKDGD